MRKNKVFFFTGINGPTGHVFNTGNKPKEADYENLFDSIPFILDVTDTAKENESGHIKTETDTRSISRALPGTDGFSRAIQAHQLPNIKNNNEPTDTVVVSTTVNGITIEEVTHLDGTRQRKDFIIKSGLSLTSATSSLIITPIANGYNIEVNPTIADTYKVKGDAADPTPNYLDSKVGNGLTVDASHQIVPVINPAPSMITTTVGVAGFLSQINYLSTNTIQFFVGAGTTLSARVLYNGTWFTEDATGLRILPNSITGNEIGMHTIIAAHFDSTAFGDGLQWGPYVRANVGDSVALLGASPNKYIGFINDVAVPGNSCYYGTNISGTKGWYQKEWEKTIVGGIHVAGSSNNGNAPDATSLGHEGKPFYSGSLGIASNDHSQSMYFCCHGITNGAVTDGLTTSDSKELWLPDKSRAFVEGTVIGVDRTTGNWAMFKVSFIASCDANTVKITKARYDDSTAFVAQSGVSPYATAYDNSIAGTSDMYIETSGLADNEFHIILMGTAGSIIDWTGNFKMHLTGYDTWSIPTYTP